MIDNASALMILMGNVLLVVGKKIVDNRIAYFLTLCDKIRKIVTF